MNIFKSFLTAVLTVLVLNSFAQVEIKLNTSKSEFRVLESSPYKIKAKASVDKIKTMPVSTVEGTFIELGLNGFSKIYDAGKPQLPVYNKLIEIPYGAEVKINIISYTEQNIQLSSTGIVNKLMPAQPSVSKSADPSEIPFYYDRILYQTNAFTQAEMVTVTQTGTMRGVQVGNLTVAPFRYNPVTNTLKVYNDLVFEVVFKHPDIALTEQMKEKYYSPYFESSLGTLINYTPPAAKDEITQYPVKYVIIAYSSTSLNLQTALQPFVYWKRQKGFNVIEQYYSSVPSTTTIKTYLQGLYDAATPTDPAPTFVLLVGDVGQIPTYTGIADNAHKTDLYYFTMDGTSDYLADMYYGRFSATSTTHVNNQVNKTLQYEKYTMPKKTYMDTVVMVAGYDSYGNDATYGNGQINYGTNNYFNASHGMYTYTFLDPNNTEAIAGANMRAAIYKGVGYANYTAHCSSGGWGTPEFSTSQIANMYNADKYGLLVGNCCQSNTFNDTECFGEALLRAYSNKGAVGYIGASDYSYWDEDYYWGVGARSSIQVNPTYDANNLGSYDCMFHEHGEAKTKWFVTNDQMRIAGLLAVEASSSTMKKYYWEEYHLMGDPSVMNYFSVPDPLTVNYTNPQNVGINSLVVNTEEDAYVAISHNGVLYDAELALAGGVVTLNFAAITSPDTLDVVVTKQNKQPFIGTLRIMAASIPLDAEMVSINTPEATYSCSGFSVAPEVTVRNMGTTTLTSFNITYSINGNTQPVYNWNGSLASMASVNITLPQINIPEGSSNTFTATTSQPNGSTDQNAANDSKTLNFSAVTVPVSSDFSVDTRDFCDAPGTVNFTNTSQNAASYSWDFGDGGNSTDANPSHTYTELGTYTITLVADAGICGSDTEIKTAFINVGAPMPLVYDDSRCGPGSVTLTASGSGTLNWYDAISGGSLLTTGTTYVTPSLSTTTSYYVESLVDGGTAYTGLTNKVNSTSNNVSAEQGLIFTSQQAFILKSVKIYSLSTGTAQKEINLKNSDGSQTLATTTVSVPSGESRVTLNFNVPVGTNLKLVSPKNSYLHRDNNLSPSPYPITLPGVLSITTSTASSDPLYYYYYFYDWEVEMPDCNSARSEVTATIFSAEPDAQFTYVQNNETIDFTNTSTNGGTYFWDFGDSITSTDENPSHTYLANDTFHVMLIATNDCDSDTTYQDVVIVTSGIAETSFVNVEIYPNPADEIIWVKINRNSVEKLTITDMIGRELKTIAAPGSLTQIDMSGNSEGVYFIRLYEGDKIYTYRFTKVK